MMLTEAMQAQHPEPTRSLLEWRPVSDNTITLLLLLHEVVCLKTFKAVAAGLRGTIRQQRQQPASRVLLTTRQAALSCSSR